MLAVAGREAEDLLVGPAAAVTRAVIAMGNRMRSIVSVPVTPVVIPVAATFISIAVAVIATEAPANLIVVSVI